MPKKKSGSTVPANETKSQKFSRLANQRVNRVMSIYKQIGALGGVAYESTPEQTKKIGEALKASHDRAMDQLNKRTVTTQEFKL
jgi:hypothetical protein